MCGSSCLKQDLCDLGIYRIERGGVREIIGLRTHVRSLGYTLAVIGEWFIAPVPPEGYESYIRNHRWFGEGGSLPNRDTAKCELSVQV